MPIMTGIIGDSFVIMNVMGISIDMLQVVWIVALNLQDPIILSVCLFSEFIVFMIPFS